MKIYTKTGDKGETSLFGGRRVWKNDTRINAYGTVDELNSVFGLILTEIKNEELKQIALSIQHELFIVGSDLATPNDKGNKGFLISRIDASHTKRLEEIIDKYESQLPELRNFILPGGLKGAALLHNARTICRRAEREVISLARKEEINSELEIYLNRLSDLLFVLARFENFSNGKEDIFWRQ
jgi:cob(I)alamin adenosyltransferase